jgi:hypothetical protein
MIAGHDHIAAVLNLAEAGSRIGSVSDHIAEAQRPIDPLLIEELEYGGESLEVAVDVRDDRNSQGDLLFILDSNISLPSSSPPLPTGIAGEWVLGRMTAGILVKSRDMKRPLRRNIGTWSLSAALFLGEHWSSTKLFMLHGSTGNIGK